MSCPISACANGGKHADTGTPRSLPVWWTKSWQKTMNQKPTQPITSAKSAHPRKRQIGEGGPFSRRAETAQRLQGRDRLRSRRLAVGTTPHSGLSILRDSEL